MSKRNRTTDLSASETAMRANGVRATNSELVRRLLGDGRVATRAELAVATSLTPQALGPILGDLVDSGLVIEQPASRSGPGRPPAEFRLDPLGLVTTSIFIRYADAYIVLADALDQVIASERLRHRVGSSATPLVKRTVRVLTGLLDEHAIPIERLQTITLSTEGSVDESRGLVIDTPAWTASNVDLPSRYRKHLAPEVHVSVVSAQRVLAMAALATTAPDPNELIAIVEIGHQIRLMLARHGELVSNLAGDGGALHHYPIAGNGRRCPCGIVGCLGTRSGGTAVVERYEKLTGTRVDAAIDVIDRVGQGDRDAIDAVRESTDWLGRGIGPLLGLLRPDRVLVTGAVGGPGSGGVRHLETALRRHLHPSLVEVPIEVVQPMVGSQSLTNMLYR